MRRNSPSGDLVLMDTPGYDVESVVGKVAGGCQVVAFTTGRGSTTGNPLAPVIKVTGNPKTAERLANNMDVDASAIIEGESLDSVGERIYETLLSVASGDRTVIASGTSCVEQLDDLFRTETRHPVQLIDPSVDGRR